MEVPAAICKVKCGLHTRIGTFLCKTANMALPANIVQRGDRFSDDGSGFRWRLEWVDKDRREKGTKKDGTVARTVWCGE